jgi:hypothetical protein
MSAAICGMNDPQDVAALIGRIEIGQVVYNEPADAVDRANLVWRVGCIPGRRRPAPEGFEPTIGMVQLPRVPDRAGAGIGLRLACERAVELSRQCHPVCEA